jgi:CBS domain-containing protein
VYDLIGGRASWTVLGLPTEGYVGDSRRIAALARPAPRVSIDSTVADVVALGSDDDDVVAVLGCDGVLIGAVHAEARSLPPDTTVESIMIAAPATIRPDLRIDEVVPRLRKDRLDRIFVTAVNGSLIGTIVLEDLHV